MVEIFEDEDKDKDKDKDDEDGGIVEFFISLFGDDEEDEEVDLWVDVLRCWVEKVFLILGYIDFDFVEVKEGFILGELIVVIGGEYF